jgi:flagellar hook-associated protein 1 FlgK
MSGIGMQTGLKALLTSQVALDTIGHNIANANTAGYSRQDATVSTARANLSRGHWVGGGVLVADVRRTVDGLLARRLLDQVSTTGRLGAQISGMSEVQDLFGEPNGFGLSGLMDGFYGSVSALVNAPSDPILQGGLAQSALELTSQFQSLVDGLDTTQADTLSQVEAHVDEVNRLAGEIATLNLEIASTETGGGIANDLRDQRDVALDALAELVDFTTQEASNGTLSVLVAGNMLVSPTRAYSMEVQQSDPGKVSLAISGAVGEVPVTGGRIGGLVRLAEEFVPTISSDLDALARNLILEVNRVHSTGIPAAGPFSQLTSENRLVDQDLDGKLEDELLAKAGLPFDVSSGQLYVNVTEESTGTVSKHRIDIDAASTTVGDLLDALDDVPSLAAGVDAFGRLSLVASAGFGFDFSTRLDTAPDHVGSFGGEQPGLSTDAAGPFALSDGDTLDVSVLPGPTSVSIPLSATDFTDIQSATAEEIAAVIAAHPGAQAAGVEATAVHGRLVLQGVGTGPSAGLRIDGGAALAGLGWNGLVGQTVSGQDLGVDVEISGDYTGEGNDRYSFVARGDGEIGTTSGLIVDVFNERGSLVAQLDVGEGYQPGTELAVAQGVSVSFGLGDVSSTHGDFFSLDVAADGDDTDVLVALGLNSLFTGAGASDISVRADILEDGSLLSTSRSSFTGDNQALLDLLDVENVASSGLEDRSVGEAYGRLIGTIGFEVNSSDAALRAGESLRTSLELRRDAVSGVNLDEEVVELMRFEQAFQAASEYISIVGRLEDELLSML